MLLALLLDIHMADVLLCVYYACPLNSSQVQAQRIGSPERFGLRLLVCPCQQVEGSKITQQFYSAQPPLRMVGVRIY